jgi:dTMP kinase
VRLGEQLSKKGILITLDGGEGCGKSTQIKLLYDYLKRQGHAVFLTREPGGTKIGDAIRDILLDNRNKGMSALTETLLYMASRAQLIEEIIIPELKKGKIVLCDRWLDATVAYQGYAGGVDVNWIRSIGKVATLGIAPKLSLYLDLPVKTGLARAKKRKKADRMESKTIKFHERVRSGYLKIAAAQPRRFQVISLKESDTIESIHEIIKNKVAHAL